jgi:hypothetical protein
VLLSHGFNGLPELVDFVAGQFWDDDKRLTCVTIIHDAALRGMIPELQQWASRVCVDSCGWPVQVQETGGLNLMPGAAPQVGPGCSLPMLLVQPHAHCSALQV